MRQVTAEELRDLDPKRFEKELCEYGNIVSQFDWYTFVEEQFTADMAPLGVRVDDLYFSLSHGQGDYASFSGRVDLMSWMDANPYSKDLTWQEAFPILYAAIKQDGSFVLIEPRYRGHLVRCALDFHEHLDCTTPDGIFANLDEETWDEEVETQWLRADIESNLRSWVESKNRGLFRRLEKEYEYLTSEAEFIDHCHANETLFDIEETEDEVAA